MRLLIIVGSCMFMSPTEWQVWNFGVLLAFVVLGISIGIAYVPGIVVAILALLFLFRNYKKEQIIVKEALEW